MSSAWLSGVPWYTIREDQVNLTRKSDLGVSLVAWWYDQRSTLLASGTSWSQDSCHGTNITFLPHSAAIKVRKEERAVWQDDIELLLYSIWTWWWRADRCLQLQRHLELNKDLNRDKNQRPQSCQPDLGLEDWEVCQAKQVLKETLSH